MMCRASMIETVLQDLRYAARMLLRKAGSTAVAVLALESALLFTGFNKIACLTHGERTD